MGSIADRVAAIGGGAQGPATPTGDTHAAGGDVPCVVTRRLFLSYRHPKHGVVRVRPAIGDTVLVDQDQADRLERLGVAEVVNTPAEAPQAVTAPVTPPQGADEGPAVGDQGRELTEDEAKALADATVPEVAEFLKANPEAAAAVRALEEGRGTPRTGVMLAINAIEAGTAGD